MCSKRAPFIIIELGFFLDSFVNRKRRGDSSLIIAEVYELWDLILNFV
jgi:hypothetical protein